MNKYIRPLIVVLLCISSISIFASQSLKETKKLVLGVIPRQNVIITNQMFTPLAQYLSEMLKVEVVLDTPKDFQTFWERVKDKKYDIVHYNQYHYVKSHKENGYNVILKNIEFNKSTIAGALVVRKDSNINSVKDLRGRKVVFGGGTRAMQGYIVAKYLLHIGGLADGEYEETFATNPPNAILSTFFKQSDAAGAGDRALQLQVVKSQIDPAEMKYLVVGEQLAHLPWAIKQGFDPVLAKDLTAIMQGLKNSARGKGVLAKMTLDGFAAARDSDYDLTRKIVKAVLKENY